MMKEALFTTLMSGIIDQVDEDNKKSELLNEAFRPDVDFNLDTDLVEVIVNAIIEEFDLDEIKISIMIDAVFNNVLAFKINGSIHEASISNMYKLFNNDLI